MPIRELLEDLRRFPWKTTGLTLLERFREDRLGLTASSLTFTTTMALVPFVTVALALFTAFPMFSQLQSALQTWLVQSLVPDSIARQVLGYLTQFAGKANRLGAAGLAVLFLTALALVMTIDGTLNAIWRVRRPRPLGQRILVYWAVMTLAPLLLGASLSLTSYVVYASRALVAGVPGGLQLLFDAIEFLLLATGLAALYRFVPNTPVRWAHAWSGALFAAVGIELARRLLAYYLAKVPTYSVVYGAFATVPILLVWIYIAWLIVLWGAVIAAYLPALLAGRHRPGGASMSRFELALEVLGALDAVRQSPGRGLSLEQLSGELRVEALQLEPVLETLVALDWVARLNEAEDEERTRFMLLADTGATAMTPLIQRLLLPQTPATAGLWRASGLAAVKLKDAL